jgi:hypothetical protein
MWEKILMGIYLAFFTGGGGLLLGLITMLVMEKGQRARRRMGIGVYPEKWLQPKPVESVPRDTWTWPETRRYTILVKNEGQING